MYIRYSDTKNEDVVLVIDELERYLGQVRLFDLLDIINKDKEPIEDDEYLYWFVEKDQLNICFNSFSSEKI